MGYAPKTPRDAVSPRPLFREAFGSRCWPALLLGLALASSPAMADGRHGRASSPPDYAAVLGPDHLLHWDHLPLRVYLAPEPGAPGWSREAALSGFAEWVRASGGLIQFQEVSAPDEADVTVAFTPQASVPGHPGVVGLTEEDTDGDLLCRVETTLATGGASPGELRDLAAHEFGHALGIDGHSEDPADMMYPALTRYRGLDGTPQLAPARAVTRRDVNTLRLCYQPPPRQAGR